MSRILGVPFQSPLRYMPERTAMIPIVRVSKLPTTSDKNFPVCQFWLIGKDPTTGSEGDLYYLERFDASGDAIWTKLADVSGISGLQKLTGDTSFAVIDAADNIDVVGVAAQGVSTTGAANTLTITVADATDTTKGVTSFNATDFTVTAGNVVLGDTIVKLVSADTGDATPVSNAITVTAGAGITTTAAGSTVTISATGALAGSFVTDVGTATPAGNALNVLGGTGVNTAGAGSTVTVNIDSPVLVANGGTGATTLTDGGIVLGSGAGAVTITGQPTDGQLLIGSSGVDPVLATLTDGTGISIVEGAGTITIGLDGAVTVPNGGTGASTFTPYAVITAGTTATGAFQNVVSVGTADQVLTSNGAGALPTFQDVSASSDITAHLSKVFYYSDFIEKDTACPFTNGAPNVTGDADRLGIVHRVTGGTYLEEIFIGGGPIVFEAITLGVLVDSYDPRIVVGFYDNSNASSLGSTDGVYFFMSRADLVNVHAVTMKAGVSTDTDTGIPYQSVYVHYEIDINDDATSVVFKADGATVATHTTNIPLITTELYVGSFGSDARQGSQTDSMLFAKTYTGPRA